MENTEVEDNFNTWIDVVKDHHPNLMMNNELLDLIRSSFMAGYTARELEVSISD